jgi:hypothetical protein
MEGTMAKEPDKPARRVRDRRYVTIKGKPRDADLRKIGLGFVRVNIIPGDGGHKQVEIATLEDDSDLPTATPLR